MSDELIATLRRVTSADAWHTCPYVRHNRGQHARSLEATLTSAPRLEPLSAGLCCPPRLQSAFDGQLRARLRAGH